MSCSFHNYVKETVGVGRGREVWFQTYTSERDRGLMMVWVCIPSWWLSTGIFFVGFWRNFFFLIRLHEFGPLWTRSTRDVWIYSKPTCTCITPVFQIRCSEWSCVTVCLGVQETKVLVRSRCWLEDGGGLPAHRVIYTQRQVSVVSMGTWPMGDSGVLWVVRIPSHVTVYLTGSPLDQGCLIIILIDNKNTKERESCPFTFENMYFETWVCTGRRRPPVQNFWKDSIGFRSNLEKIQ
jgi:hypothetical protein